VLDGSLQINAKPGYPITGHGNLDLRDATFNVEKEVLEIFKGDVLKPLEDVMKPFEDILEREENILELSQGRIFYQGGPIDDPGLDIQASRTIDDVKVGLRLTGSANNMEVVPFSDPAMDESELLSYLLTGQNIFKSGGQVMVGKEIYKDLYISYGKDLVGSGGTFKAHYDLKYGFSVETATSSKTNGADLLWSLER
ncbi:MAG: hypothetical protein D3924_19625, partial [Candidatus Electrothrix sp. AR4]|nr:hypothetical protein [Candidatus Electrothrix sp. AR4]